MHDPEVPQPHDLHSWDWQAELRAQERSLAWLARHTGIHYQALYRMTLGGRPSPEYLEAIARVLKARS
jgi:hypothetical protein